MNGARSAWFAARARNAARKGWWIVAVGLLAIIGTTIALVFVPRAADRQLQARLAALPTVPDTLPIQHRIDSLRAVLTQLDSALNTSVATSISPDSTIASPSTTTAATASALAPDSGSRADQRDLEQRIARARSIPLAESFRALANAPALNHDARVAALLDTIDRVDREREAHAALGGPGVRYAALTARLTSLGRSLVAIAAGVADVASLRARTNSSTDSVAVDGALANRVYADSLRRTAQREQRSGLVQRIALETSLRTAARERAVAIEQDRAQLEARRAPRLPWVGILFAALVVGLSVGYTAVLAREWQRPTVGDIAELQRISGAPIVVHAAASGGERPRAHNGTRRERPGVPAIIDRDSDAFAVIHLALTSVGDIVTQVDLLSDSPSVAAAVALSTAAVAATESRAVLVIDRTKGVSSRGVLAPIVGAVRRANRSGAAPGNGVTTDALDTALHAITIDRDTTIDLQLDPPPDIAVWERLASRYDVRFVIARLDDTAATSSRDVVLCVQQGRTPLAWLSRAVAHAQAHQQRIRALVLWSHAAPTV